QRPGAVYTGHQEDEPNGPQPNLSNAMDVGNPSNFVRIQNLFNNDFKALSALFSSASYTDDQTIEALKKIYKNAGYIADPHGAVGYLGLKKYQENNPGVTGVFLETAHPVKFLDTVEEALEIELPIPAQIKSVIAKEKTSITIASYEDLKNYLNTRK